MAINVTVDVDEKKENSTSFFSRRINLREIDLVFFSGKVIIYYVGDKTETRLKVVHGLAYRTSQIKLSVIIVLFISAILI